MTQFFEPEAPEIDPSISCSTCEACCCKLEVLLMGDDDVPLRLVAEDEWGGSVMRRLDDDWCAALDRNTMLCTIYERRPDVCGNEPRIVRTRIPVWTLEQARQLGASEADILRSYPTLRAEDLAHAWTYVRSHRDEIDSQIRDNEEA